MGQVQKGAVLIVKCLKLYPFQEANLNLKKLQLLLAQWQLILLALLFDTQGFGNLRNLPLQINLHMFLSL